MTFAAGDDNMPCNSTSQSREVFGQPLLGAFAVPRDTRKNRPRHGKLWEFACQYHAIMQQGSSTRQYTI